MTERKRVTLEFFEQLREPERSEAINNYIESDGYIPKTINEALYFCTVFSKYLESVRIKLLNNTDLTKPFSIEELAEEMYPVNTKSGVLNINNVDRRKIAIDVYNKLKALGLLK